MGHQINPTGFRIGISKDWASRWYAPKRSYADVVLEDQKIRAYLEKNLEMAGLKEIQIDRTENEVQITIRVSKPGMVIGRGGTGVELIEKALKKLTTAKVKITAEEVKTPEIEAELVAQYIARQLKKRVPHRRVVNFAMNSAMDKGAKGIKIQLSGVLSGGNTIARVEKYSRGKVPLQTLRADIDYSQVHGKMIFGTIGIKVWVYKGEKEIK